MRRRYCYIRLQYQGTSKESE